MSTSPRSKVTGLVVLLLLGVGAALIFTRLDNGLLWNDEAQTALLAQQVMKYGVPQVRDGARVISEWRDAPDANNAGCNVSDPWGQFYVAAASFGLSEKVDTFFARLPFAVIGWLSLLAAFFLYRELARSDSVACWGMLLVVTNVPMLLHFRQARYYSSVILFTVLAITGYSMALRGRRPGHLLLVVSLVLLSYFFYPHGIFVGAALLIHWLMQRVRGRAWTIDIVVILICVLPLAALHLIHREHLPDMPGWDWGTSPQYALRLFGAYLYKINLYGVPFVFVPMYLCLSRRGRCGISFWVCGLVSVSALCFAAAGWLAGALWQGALAVAISAVAARFMVKGSADSSAAAVVQDDERGLDLALIIVVAVVVVGFSITIPPLAYFRYVVICVPLLLYFPARILDVLARRSRVWGVVLAAALVLTNLAAILPLTVIGPGLRWLEGRTSATSLQPAPGGQALIHIDLTEDILTRALEPADAEDKIERAEEPVVTWLPLSRADGVSVLSGVSVEGILDGGLVIDVIDTSDPYVVLPDSQIDGDVNKWLIFDITNTPPAVAWSPQPAPVEVGFYFRRVDGDFGPEMRIPNIRVWYSPEPQLYAVDCSMIENWQGRIAQLRIDFTGLPKGDRVKVHRVGVSSRLPERLRGRTVLPVHDRFDIVPYAGEGGDIDWLPIQRSGSIRQMNQISTLALTEDGLRVVLSGNVDPHLVFNGFSGLLTDRPFIVLVLSVPDEQYWSRGSGMPFDYRLSKFRVGGFIDNSAVAAERSLGFGPSPPQAILGGRMVFVFDVRDIAEELTFMTSLRFDMEGVFDGMVFHIDAVGLAAQLPPEWAPTLQLQIPVPSMSSTHRKAARHGAVRLTDYRPKSPVFEYTAELRHTYRGPIDGIVEHLKRHAKPGDMVKTSYNSFSLMFYLPKLKIVPFRTVTEQAPDWVIPRPHERLRIDAAFRVSVNSVVYKRIWLDVPDIPYQNKPDPALHRYRTDTAAPRVVIFQRVQ